MRAQRQQPRAVVQPRQHPRDTATAVPSSGLCWLIMPSRLTHNPYLENRSSTHWDAPVAANTHGTGREALNPLRRVA